MSEKEKMNVNTAPAVDTSTGTAEDVEAIMKKYDRESNTRIWEGVPKKVVRYLLAAFALLMVYMNLFANWDERVRRSLFVGIVIILSFLVYPAKKGSTKKNHIPIYDIVLMVLGAGAYFYFVINFKTIMPPGSASWRSLWASSVSWCWRRPAGEWWAFRSSAWRQCLSAMPSTAAWEPEEPSPRY